MYNLNYIRRKTKKKLSKVLDKDKLSQQKLSFRTYHNAIILPGNNYPSYASGGVIDCEGHLIKSSQWHENIGGSYKYDLDSMLHEHTNVIYIGYFHYVWGHVITDNLKKLWFLFTREGKQLIEKGVKIVYITIENKPLPTYAKEILSLANINSESLIWINSPTQFDNIIIPDNSFISTSSGRIYTKEFTNIIDKIKNSVSAHFKNKIIETFDKIYFTRTLLKDNGIRDFGEKQLENIFYKKGYKIIAPEKHNVYEQILFLMSCKSFAVTEGSISHNAIFCQDGTELIILLKADYVNGYQPAINCIANVNVTYIDAHWTPYNEMPWAGPFYMNITPYLARWAKLPPSISSYTHEYIYIYSNYIISIKKRFKKFLYYVTRK